MTFRGIAVPLLTPFDDSGGIDGRAIPDLVARMLDAGVEGLVALGTTGEFADLTAHERAEVAEAVVSAAAGRVPVLVGVGAVGTSEACELARDAERAGADGVLALPPLYWKLGDGGLVRHFATVAAASALPVYLYDFPALSGTPIGPALVDRIAREIPEVVGIKQSGPELRLVHGVVARVKEHRPDFAVLVGSADLVLPALLAGADGAIIALGNVFPAPLVALQAAVRKGDLDEAARLHRRVLELLALPALSAPPILALKAGAQALGALVAARVRTDPDDHEAVVAAAAALAAKLAGTD